MSTIPHSLSPHCWRFVIIIGNVRSYTYTYPTYIHTYVYTYVCVHECSLYSYMPRFNIFYRASKKRERTIYFGCCLCLFYMLSPLWPARFPCIACVRECVCFLFNFFLHYFLFPIHFSFVLYSSCWLSLIPHFLLSFHTALVLSAPLSSFEYLLSPLKSSTSGVVEIDVDVNFTEKTRNAWGVNNCKSWINQKWKEKHSRQLKFTHLYLLPSQTYAVP